MKHRPCRARRLGIGKPRTTMLTGNRQRNAVRASQRRTLCMVAFRLCRFRCALSGSEPVRRPRRIACRSRFRIKSFLDWYLHQHGRCREHFGTTIAARQEEALATICLSCCRPKAGRFAHTVRSATAPSDRRHCPRPAPGRIAAVAWFPEFSCLLSSRKPQRRKRHEPTPLLLVVDR